MPESDHVTSPDPNRSPYAHMGDDELLAAYERATVYADSPELEGMVAELQRRDLLK